MAVEKVGVYRKWLEPVPRRNGKATPKSEWSQKRRHRWIVRWYGTNNKKYGKVFKTRKEAERYALELQKRVNIGKGNKPRKILLRAFRLEHERVMKGQNEILNLTWADVDFENHQIHVTPKNRSAETIEWEPKDHEKRVVPISNETAQLLADLQAQAKEGFPYVFIPPKRFDRIRERLKNRRWTSRSEIINNLRKNFNVIRERAGITKCTLHDLRRSAITNWAGQLPIQVVQQLAGHSNISTTRKYYLAVRPEDVVSANKVLNDILAKTWDD